MFVLSPDTDPLQRTIVLLNTITVCRGMPFLVPVIVPYFATQIGLDFQQFLASEAIFAAVMVSCEVPSGWLADIWRRKSVMVLGGVLSSVGAALFLLADDFYGAALAQAVMGVGLSLFSGADSALLYDSLHQHGQQDRYRALEGRRHGFGLYAVAASSVLGAALYVLHPVLPVAAMTVSFLAAGLCALGLQEPTRQRQAPRPVRLRLAPLLHANRTVVFAVLSGAVLFASTSVAMWSQQPYYIALGIGEQWFGVLMAMGYLAGGLAGHFGHLANRWFGTATSLALIWLILVLAFGLAGLWPGYTGVVLLLTGSAAWGAGWPLVQTIINQQVGGARRATVLSIAAGSVKLAFVPLSALIGWLATDSGIAAAILGLTAIMFVLGGPVLWLLRRNLASPTLPRISMAAPKG